MESVGRLAGGVAHDFNNMLQAILGNVALALEQAPVSGQLHDDLIEVQKAAQRSASLTSQLLAFARKQTVRPQLLDLNDTVTGMLNMLRRLIGENLHLAWLPGPGLWLVQMDPSQVDQMLANLTVNARDAIKGAGKITIETSNMTLDDTYAQTHADCVPGEYVLLVVSDTGCGMNPETQGHLFEPFFTTKDVGEGTGLGLATVYGIVKQNDGLISVYSELGRGTTFKIYLPRAKAQAQPAAVIAEGKPLRGTETVLLVEDETQVLKLGQRILKQQGYTVLTAPTPKAALALTAQHQGPLHLLITDVVMPGMNGKELLNQLQSNYPGLKCLFMSGYTADVIAHHGVLDKGVQFLQKPFTVRTLTDKVREVLAQSLKTQP
jgi:CheY-like chemotaxis protein